jgi:hypothetical protein
MRIRRSTRRGLCLPATFRPQGLITLSTAYSLRTPAGFVSHQQRSWDSPFGVFPSREACGRFRQHGPTYRFSLRCYHRENGGPARRAAVPGPQPPESPWRLNAWLARKPLDTPLGFALLGSTAGSLVRAFTRTPLTRLTERTSRSPPPRVRLRVSISPHLAPSPQRAEAGSVDEAALLGFLHRFAPEHTRTTASGLWVHLTPRRTLLPTDRRSLKAI